MAFSLTGYVLEKPRVSGANSPFTLTPDDLVSDQFAYGTAYPPGETNPRTDYLVFVVTPGDLKDATFAWTKNEVISRFDYDGRVQRFSPLPGGVPASIGFISAGVNTQRLSVPPPVTPAAQYPLRVSLGDVAAGVTLTTTTVGTDGDFSTPSGMSTLTCEISRATGNLNFSADILTGFDGVAVKHQRQSFFAFRDAANIGVVGDFLILNPIPGLGAGSSQQIPLLRIGFQPYLTAISVANDGALGAPSGGTFQWSMTTGTIRLSPADVTASGGRPVYYDGVVWQYGISMPRDAAGTVGTVAVPLSLSNMPSAGGDLIFRVPFSNYQFPETIRVDVGGFDAIGKAGQVQTDKLGNVQFSQADIAVYGGFAFEVIRGDIPIDHGISLRLFRTPVDPGGTNPDEQDVTAIYSTTGAILKDPIDEQPTVPLPATPQDDGSLVVNVSQGTGQFTGALQRLDVDSPPMGLGYVIDFDARKLQFAARRQQVILTPQAIPTVQIQDPLVQTRNFILEGETGTGTNVYVPVPADQYILNGQSGVVQAIETFGAVLVSSSSGSLAITTLTDGSQDFIAAGVEAGDLVDVQSGSQPGIYTVGAVLTNQLTISPSGPTEGNVVYSVRRGPGDILADRFWQPLTTVDPTTKIERIRGYRDSGGTPIPAQNSPRLSILPANVDGTRFRFGQARFAVASVVANDASFGSPPGGTVEISRETGHLNFSASDISSGDLLFSVTQVFDARIRPNPGLIQTTDRMLAGDEMLITYVSGDGGPPGTIVERAAYLVRKEATADHPAPTNLLTFNPLGSTIAPFPPVKVWRGGRPQTAKQVIVDVLLGTIRFLDDGTITNAIPHGPIVQPTERVTVDYYVYEALGGENTVTVLRPPMQLTQVTFTEGSSQFVLPGNRTADVPVGSLLRLDGQDIYRITGATFSTDTTVTIGGSFRQSLTAPPMDVSSEPISPLYFLAETGMTSTPQGMVTVQFMGDRTALYGEGVVVRFTGGFGEDLYGVLGSNLKDGLTTVTLQTSTRREYPAWGAVSRSIRPIYSTGQTTVRTSRQPILTSPFAVIRTPGGQVGQVLTADEYVIDDGGRIVLSSPLGAGESVSAFYVGYKTFPAGPRLRVTYTAIIAPADNGLKGQTLTADYRTYSPDGFYWRVETMTNFRGEVAAGLQRDASQAVPTGGPVLSNGSQPKLWDQGRPSVYFPSGRLENEDIVGRAYLKYWNDAINLLEDLLADIDGRVVGDRDGRFLFDGVVGNPVRTSMSQVTNDIDDVVKTSDAPFTVSFPPFPATLTSIGTFSQLYSPNPLSRLFPTSRARYGITTGGADTSANDGDPILDIGSKNLTTVVNLHRRIPRARISQDTLMGATTLTVDNADGTPVLIRPPFQVGQLVVITNADGSPLVTDGSPLTVGSVGSTTLGVTALPIDVPEGATVYLAPSDTSYTPFTYIPGFDVGVDLTGGHLLFQTGVAPFFPVADLDSGTFLDMTVTLQPIQKADRIPALTGGQVDDDGDVQIPLLGPRADRESGWVVREGDAIGDIMTATTPSFVGVGNLDAPKTTITLQAGSFPTPVPKVGDLVRILDGLNGATQYRTITAVGASSVAVASAFSTVDSGFHFTVTVSQDPISGSATFPSSTVLEDLSADFVAAAVKVGHTVVITSGAASGQRRQVTTVATTQLGLSSAPTSLLAATYRVAKSIGTFSTLGPLLGTLAGEVALLSTNVTPIASEKKALEGFLDLAFTDVVPSQTGTVSGTVLTGTTTFVTDGVVGGDYIYVRSGLNGGIYRVVTVTSETTLTVDVSFPSAGSVTYRAVTALGVSQIGLTDVYAILAALDVFLASTVAWQAATGTIGVVGDGGAFATGILSDGFAPDVSSRLSDLMDRQSYLGDPAGPITKAEKVLSGGDRLYDQRITWIDHRVDPLKGILTRRDREVALREQRLADQVAALLKLASVTA